MSRARWDGPRTSLHCLVEGGSQVRLQLGLGAKLQQHVDARSTAAAARVEEGRGSVNRHSVDLLMSRETQRIWDVSIAISKRLFRSICLEKFPMLVNEQGTSMSLH